MSMRDLKSIAVSNGPYAGPLAAFHRRDDIRRNSPSPEEVRAQQIEHGKRVEARQRINGRA